MTDNIILRIAGLGIKLYFDPSNYPFSKEKLKNDIMDNLGGFIDPQENNIDFEIYIQQNIDNDIIYKRKEKSFYFKIFEVKKKRIDCCYEISFGQISFIIRHILLLLLYKRNGFLMHGSAVAINGKAYIFTGPSGAGKSTIMKMLNEEYPALADDSVIIKQEKGKYYLYQTPIIEKESWVNKQSEKYPIEGIFLLKKSKNFEMKKIIGKKKVVKKLIGQLFINQDQGKKQIHNLIDFIKIFNRFDTLFFAKDQKKLLEFFSKNIV